MSIARDKIFKSWSGINEVALIKEVATKGEHIQLCKEYWSRKRKLSLVEYEPIFYDVVKCYVERLLSERLVCKAENVLRNVQLDVRCFYFQFACECGDDEELRETIFDHLRKKDPSGFEQNMQELQFHFRLLMELLQCPATLARCKEQMSRINLEALMSCETTLQQRLMVELYFANGDLEWLPHLDKFVVWNFLVETQKMLDIIRWCCLNANADSNDNLKPLELKYCQWTLESEMFEYALRTLERPSDVLRNCFAMAGYFFADERDDVAIVLRRVCTTQSFSRNRELLEKLPMGRFLLDRSHFFLMLCDFVSSRELEELADKCPEQSEILQVIVSLKNHNLQNRLGFEKVSQMTKLYLESCQVDFESEQQLATLHEFLCNEPTVASLHCFLPTSALQRIPYLKSLMHRMDYSNNSATGNSNLPTPYDLLRKFKNVEFRKICKDTSEVASFSNQRLCEKYARKYQLNYLHHLKQQRGAFAVYYLFTTQLQHYTQFTRTLVAACESVCELALQYGSNADLVVHCVAFIEMLGFDTQMLRIFLKLSRLVNSDCVSSYASLISQVESVLLQRLKQQPDEFPLADYQALMNIVSINQQRICPELIMQQYALKDDWWRLLVLLQYFDVPLSQVQQLAKHFKTPAMGEHLLRSLLYDPPPAIGERYTKRNASFSRQHPRKQDTAQTTPSVSVETLTSSISSFCNHDANAIFKTNHNQPQRFLSIASGNFDLFALILLSNSSMPEERIANAAKFLELMQDNNTYATSSNLMKNCLKFRLPVLAVLASTVSDANIDWHWVVWLALATDQWNDVLRTAAAAKDTQELVWCLIQNSVRLGETTTLYRSFCIFFKDNPLGYLLKFLHRTQHYQDFGDDVVHDLRLYLLAWSNDEVQLPLSATTKRLQLMLRSIKLLLVHLQCNFVSALEQQKFLGCICHSDMSDISDLLDFCLLNKVFAILQDGARNCIQRFPIDFEQLLQRDSKEYKNLLAALLKAKEYDLAIQLASLLHMPICDIVYSKWVAGIDGNESLLTDLTFQQYENEIAEHALPPEMLVNFFLYASSRLEKAWAQKYMLFKRALNIIKRHHLFPNESFDRDQIEYEMIVCYLNIEDDDFIETLDIYHSEYFEEIMLKERCVLYKSFLELKELAGIEDLNLSLRRKLTDRMQQRLVTLLNRLLDLGDIVEALRLQQLFECRPIDLRFVVFCMALAEGVTTIFSMSPEERQLLRDIEKSAFSKFNKRTLDSIRGGSGSNKGYSSPLRTSNGNDLSDSCSTLEFEEIPSKEKRETLDTIQGIASKLTYGIELGKRIVMAYRAAMYLDKEYLDVLRTKDANVLLQSVSEEGCLHRLLVVSDILTSTHMTAQEIAELLAFEITTAVVRPRFYIFSSDQQATNTLKNVDLWGYNVDRDLHIFLELTPNTTKLGNCLLEYCDALKAYRKFQDYKAYEHSVVFEKLAEIISIYGLPSSSSSSAATSTTATSVSTSIVAPPQVLSHKKQNIIYVELLIKAHQCFVHECSMEGIADVLNRAKVLNSVLTNAKSWSLIVRMLIGIARYREMFYCFDALITNEQFESLLGQFDEDKTIGLRQAIIAYLREYAPENAKEYFKLAALHFLMYKELAEMWKEDAKDVLGKILTTSLVSSAQFTELNALNNWSTKAKTQRSMLKTSTAIITLLHQALQSYTHATENYLLDNKMLQAQKSASMAEMIAMQIDLASCSLDKSVAVPNICVCVLNVQKRDEFRELVNSEMSVPQAIILSHCYGYDINWSEVLLSQFVILQKKTYLSQYLAHLPISDSVIENVVKGFQLYAQHHKPTSQMEGHLAELVNLVKSITLKYKLASLLAIKTMVMSLINEQTMHYLRDTNYGRNEFSNMPDM